MTDLEPKPGRRRAMGLVAVAIPLLFFALAEIVLRIAGFGHEYPLFIDNPGDPPGYRLANPEVIKRFFSDPRRAPPVSIETSFFPNAKSANTLRLVVQGGSTAAGFPYGLSASLAGMIQHRMRQDYPHREVEVISTAMSAVNSYTLLDFADEIIAEHPDAILIYAGHNEFLGVLGVGSALSSTTSRGLTLFILKLRSLRLYQLLERVINKLSGPPPKPEYTGGGQTLMARAPKETNIVLGSPLYQKGVAQFRSNLDALLAHYAKAGVPVYIGTLVSNERDLAPFVSDEGAEGARAYFDRADQAARDGDWEAARSAYREARDRDGLRFRAPSEFNGIIEKLAERHGARLIDVEGRFWEQSADGVPGAGLLVEHVHPNLDGFFVLADAFYDALVNEALPGRTTAPLSDDEARENVPVSILDELLAQEKIRRVTSGWPFSSAVTLGVRQPDPAERELAARLIGAKSDWVSLHRELKAYYQRSGNLTEELRVSLMLADAFPFAPALQTDAARTLDRAGRKLQALRYWHLAARMQPGNTDTLLGLAEAFRKAGTPERAEAVLNRVLEIDPGNKRARALIERHDGALP